MRFTKLVGVLAGLTLFTASCGSDDSSTTTDAPVTDDAGSDATVVPTTPSTDAGGPADDVPTRIISLSPTHTEMLFAIGAGDQVVGVDDFSNHPAEAAEKMSGLSGYEPNVEAIAALEPDLVVTDGTNPDLLGQLDSLGIARWEGPAAVSFSDVFDQIEQLGAATGNVGDAAEVVSSMQTEIDEITASLPEVDEPLTYYHELDNTYFSITSDTFIGYVYSQLGLRSIADLAEGSGGPYPQLSAEFIVSADPDLIFQACTKYCGETAETMAARDGWGELSAVRNGLVIEMDDDIASRWGPRIVDYYRDVADAVRTAAELESASS